MFPTCIMQGLSHLLKCSLIKYFWQPLGLSHLSSQITLIMIIANSVCTNCHHCPAYFISVNSLNSSQLLVICCLSSRLLEDRQRTDYRLLFLSSSCLKGLTWRMDPLLCLLPLVTCPTVNHLSPTLLHTQTPEDKPCRILTKGST